VKKIFNWEFWPSFMFYLPLVPYACYLALKSRSVGFFLAANPGIQESGNGLESKYSTLLKFPNQYRPNTIFVQKNSAIEQTINSLKLKNILFPLIAKPDIGFRGLLVKKIYNIDELNAYLTKYNSINLLIQEYIDLPNECGIFYIKNLNNNSGEVTSLTLKKYLSVIGNGTDTLKSLILKNNRSKNYAELMFSLHKEKLENIIQINEEFILSTIGNHAKGTQFINGNYLISSKLNNMIHDLSQSIVGWNYGRLDIKYHNFNDLVNGKNFKIIELNGIISEPTHIYDAEKGTYFSALKNIAKHWKYLQKIAVENHKNNQVTYASFSYVSKLYFRYNNYLKTIKKLADV
jgi:hypothetical protein